jgi:carbon storage regulator
MLVLSRKEGEQISIGPDVSVTVLGIHKGRVRLGFAAPAEVPIYRNELLQDVAADDASDLAARSRSAEGTRGAVG